MFENRTFEVFAKLICPWSMCFKHTLANVHSTFNLEIFFYTRCIVISINGRSKILHRYCSENLGENIISLPLGSYKALRFVTNLDSLMLYVLYLGHFYVFFVVFLVVFFSQFFLLKHFAVLIYSDFILFLFY